MKWIEIWVKGRMEYHSECTDDTNVSEVKQTFTKRMFDNGDFSPELTLTNGDGDVLFEMTFDEYIMLDDLYMRIYTYDNMGNKVITEEI